MKNWLNARLARMFGTHGKWLCAIALIAVMGLSGCPNTTGGDVEGEGELTDSEIEQIYAELEQAQEENADGVEVTPQEKDEDGRISIGESEPTFIGYGINVFGGPTITSALKSPVIQAALYQSNVMEGEYLIDSAVLTESKFTYTDSSTLTEAYTSLDLSAEFHTGSAVPYFSGDVSAKYGSSGTTSGSVKFYNALYSQGYKKQVLNSVYQFPEFFVDIMQPNMRKLINSSKITPAQIFERVGTHIIVDSSLGGNLSLSAMAQIESSESTMDVSAALNFETAYVGGSVSTDLSERQKQIAENTTLTVTAAGGNVELIGANTDVKTLLGKVEQWAATIKNAPTIGAIYGTIPVWELAETAARQKELKDAFDANAAAINGNLNSYFSITKTPLIVDGGIYYIQNWQSQKTIHIRASQGRLNLFGYDPNGSDKNEQWKAVASNNAPGYFMFQSQANTQLVWDIPGMNISQPIGLYAQNGSRAQLFRLIENGDGSVFIESILSNLGQKQSLRAQAPGTHSDGTLIYLKNNATDPAAKWKVIKVE